MDIRNLPALCGDHIRRLGEIYRSHRPQPEKESAFEASLRDTSNCGDCLARANPSGPDEIQVDMTIWNIMGNSGFRELLKEAYFHGAGGALYISDGTRPDGLDSLDGWVSDLFDVTGPIPTVILVNRKGELGKKIIEESVVAAKAKTYDAPYFYSSTKTGENVERALQLLAERVEANRFRPPGV